MQVIAQMSTPAAPATRAGRVILVERDSSYEPYVTAWIGDGDKSWCWGHYFDSETEARADFFHRCQRGY